MAKVSVILPAAGSGTRFGGERNKIFQPIQGRPMFLRTLELFTRREDVVQVQLVVSPADMPEVSERLGGQLRSMGVNLCEGGAQRGDSVRNALARVRDDADLVCVHDAVRPCVSPLWIDAVFAQAHATGAAILAYPIHGTLKKVGDTTIQQTVSREHLWEAQTPQVFRTALLRRAYEHPTAATDDAALVEALGEPVRVVLGDPRNIKVTTPGDLALAEAVIDSIPKPKKKNDHHPFAEAQW